MIRKIVHIVFFLVSAGYAGLAQSTQPSVYSISKMSLSQGAFSEISPVIVSDGIIFCSDRRFSGIRDRTDFAGKRIYNIYFAEKQDTSGWSRPVEIKSERTNLFNNGPLCIAPDGKTVYFTSEVETGKIIKRRKFKNHSGIFIADLEGTSLVSIRPFRYNNSQYDVGQPSISIDGKYLFFASNMPGGQGASDIYYSEWVNGDWGNPVNLGPEVNSPGADNYPYMHKSGRLFFSSDRSGGFGRMDVYSSVLNLGKWEAPVIMPEPVNSSSDDFAFAAEDNLQTGYFTSNRLGNDDIFKFASTIIRKAACDTLVENNYCYQMIEENAVKFDTLPFRYEWNFGDGQKGIGPSVIHCYPGQGSYLVQLDVVNLITKEVLYNERTYKLDIKNTVQPYISSQDRGTPGERIMFNASNTNLPGWNITRYYWNFGDETIATGMEVDKIFRKPGSYNIQLIVTGEPDADGKPREACVCKNIVITP